MNLSRRNILAIGGAAVTVSLIPVDFAMATPEAAAEALNAFTGGAAVGDGGIELVAPEIAENGNTVPIGISIESPMTSDDYVADVIILAAGNPNPGVATFHFSPMSGEATAQTRMRLAKTQDIVAIAKMSDGSFYMDKRTVKVTIGGCGG